MPESAINVAIGAKADMARAPHMSAFDPKRTFAPLSEGRPKPIRCDVLASGALMRRREFLGILGGAVAWPVGSKAQQPERVRYVGMINTLGSDDPETQARITVFEQALAELGWVIGRNLKIEVRQIGGDIEHGHTENRRS